MNLISNDKLTNVEELINIAQKKENFSIKVDKNNLDIFFKDSSRNEKKDFVMELIKIDDLFYSVKINLNCSYTEINVFDSLFNVNIKFGLGYVVEVQIHFKYLKKIDPFNQINVFYEKLHNFFISKGYKQEKLLFLFNTGYYLNEKFSIRLQPYYKEEDNPERFFNVIVKDINLKPKNIKSIENKFLKEYIDIIV